MRFRSLGLRPYGPFIDATLDFGDEEGRVQVIFGHNEAGKSTTRRALQGLLFGIEERTPDAHLHDPSNLRIAAALVGDDGECIEVVRRKGRKNTLLGPDEKPIDEDRVGRFLGGVSRGLFGTLFALDHDTLVRGGEALREGEGELGESLFAAGTGVRNLHRLREQLRKDAEDLFTPLARKRALNETLRAHAEALRTVKEKSLPASDWKALTVALEADAATLAELETRHREIDHAVARFERLQRTVPAVVERRDCLVRLEGLGAVAPLPDGAPQERREAESAIQAAERRRSVLKDDQHRLESERDALSIDRAVLKSAGRVEGLAERLGVYRQAMRDRPGLRAEVAVGQQSIRALLRELGREVAFDHIESLRVGTAERSRITSLAREHERIDTALDSATRELDAAERALARHVEERARLSPARDATALRSAIERARRHGEVEDREQRLATEVRELESIARQGLEALGLWSGSLDSALELPLPLAETVDRFERDFSESKGNAARAAERLEETRQRIGEHEADRARLAAGGVVPTREERDESRAGRDRLWREVRFAWLEARPPEGSADALAARYEDAVRGSDAVADSLFDDAERATRFAALGAEIAALDERRCQLEFERDALAASHSALESRWLAQWAPVAIEPLPPTEMRTWLGRHGALVASINAWKAKAAEHDAARELVSSLRETVAGALAAVETQPVRPDESFTVVQARAEATLESIAATEARRQRLDAAIDDAARTRSERTRQLDQGRATLERWREDWAKAVEALSLPADTVPDVAESVLGTLSKLFAHHGEVVVLNERLALMDEQMDAFTAEVDAIARACGQAGLEVPPDAASEALRERLRAAREALATHERLGEKLLSITEELRGCDEARREADSTLARLMNVAGCESIEKLIEAEERADEHRAVTARIAVLEEQLTKEGIPIETLVDEAAEVDIDGLPGERAALVRERDELTERERALREQVGARRQERFAMDGRADAAIAAEEAEHWLAVMHEQVLGYTRLRLAAALLERELEHHRRDGQGPLLDRASEIFSRITLGRYTGVATGFGARDETVLECLRAGAGPVRVEGLSDGTRDQLYLALRLASIEQHVARNESLPLIVDDALVNFDDPRSRATFEVFSEIATTTQVLFFTHHAHMVELARAAIPAGRRIEHDLDALGVSTSVEERTGKTRPS